MFFIGNTIFKLLKHVNVFVDLYDSGKDYTVTLLIVSQTNCSTFPAIQVGCDYSLLPGSNDYNKIASEKWIESDA